MKYNIRLATEEDLPSIIDIYVQGTREDRSYDYADESLDELVSKRQKWWKDHDDRHPVFVAINDTHDVIGWMSLQAIDSRKILNHVGEISIYVDSNYRGIGVGESLYRHMFNFAKQHDYKKLTAVCYPDNPALKLKQKVGFEIVGIHKNHVHRHGLTYSGLCVLEKELN